MDFQSDFALLKPCVVKHLPTYGRGRTVLFSPPGANILRFEKRPSPTQFHSHFAVKQKIIIRDLNFQF